MSDTPTPPDPDLAPMSPADQTQAFRSDLEALVGRYIDEFDMEPETLIGAIQCHLYLMLADATMCYVGHGMMEDDDEEGIERVDGDGEDDDNEGEEWRNDA